MLGPSGCGKSTLLKTIAKLIPTDSGFVSFGEEHPTRRTGDLGYVFQDPTLLPWRTVLENVRLPLEISVARWPRATHASRIAEALDAVGLARGDWGKFPRQLSGGMRMRCSLARAMVTDPSVLLLDEPFAALDDMLRTRMNELLLEIWTRSPRTIVFVTHNIAEAAFLSHRVAILGNGRVAISLDNPLGFPRTRELRSSQSFAEFYGRISAALYTIGT